MLEGPTQFRSLGYNHIYHFKEYQWTNDTNLHKRIRMPSKFFFSSGLNHEEGYKLSAEQRFDEKYFSKY
jgi:hypothetical protein